MNKKFIKYMIAIALFIPFFNLGKKEYVGADKFIYIPRTSIIKNINIIQTK